MFIGFYPSQYIEQITLNDGTLVTLRPIRPDDAPRLQVTFSRLSPETIYLRFLQTFNQLSDEQARKFANIDYQEQMALVGSIQEEEEERLIGVARYALLSDHEPGLAEAAVVVRDDYQNRGLGKIILDRLVRYAREHGVSAFLATVQVSNARIVHFIKRSGLPFERKMLEPGVWEIRIQL
jgi:acetyltransferase